MVATTTTTTTTSSSSMESAASQVNLPTAPPAAAIISEQPKPNTMLPLPATTIDTNNLNQLDVEEEQEMGLGLRGGWMTIGKHFNCCGLNCGFSKTF